MKILSVILLLEIAVLVYSETCPYNEEIAPCVCRKDSDDIQVDCIGSSFRKLTLDDLEKPVKRLAGKTNVNIALREMKLGRMPSDIFKGIGVNRLRIENCDLDSLGERPLTGLEDSLEVLIIQRSFDKDDDLTQLKLGHLSNLKNFHLSLNSIKEVSNNWFKNGPASLERILMSGNAIEKLGDRAFADLSNLNYLLLKENIGSIERGMLPRFINALNELKLGHNALTSLPADIFTDMPQLRRVNFESNRFTRLDWETWNDVWEQLDGVWLQGNSLVCDSSMNWMIGLRTPYVLLGSCTAPEAKRGMSLKDFIKQERALAKNNKRGMKAL